jgi:alpha-beta hydrolase superfamily lysophospholipase
MRTEARFPRVGAKAGHYESFYLKATRPGGGLGIWIRYTIHKRPDAQPTASLWVTLFDAEADGPRATKATYTAGALSFPVDAYIRIGEALLMPGRASGWVAGGPSSDGPSLAATWDLEFADGAPAFRHLPRRWMYRARIPRTKLLSPYPRTTVSGSVSVGDRAIDVDGWPAMIGHNWGSEHAERWVWIEAPDLDGTASYLDIAAGRIAIGPFTTPWIANGVLGIDGERIRLGGFGRIRSTKLAESPTACEFFIAGRGVAVSGRVAADPSNVVGWVYADPAGAEHNTLNCSISDLEVTVHRRGVKRQFRAAGSAAYEIGIRETGHGIRMQPYPDGTHLADSDVAASPAGADSPPASTTSDTSAPDGTRLLVRRWAAVDPWAEMLLLHGVGEHSGRYERTGGLFAAAGISVTAFDLRGNGGSGGRRADVARWADFHDDIEAMLARVRSGSQGRPVVLLGHSMGGLLCTEYLLSERPQPDLAVLSAPGLDDGLPRWQHAIAPIASRVLPRLALKNAWGPEALSRDPDVGRRARQDPGCPQKATVRLGAASFAAQERVRSSLDGLRLTTLVFHGGDDPLVPPRASEPFEGILGVTRRLYPGLRHECFNEPEGPEVCADVIDWLRRAITTG